MKKLLLSIITLILPFLTFAQETTIDERIEAGFAPFAKVVSDTVFTPFQLQV